MKKRFVIPGVLLGALLALPGSALAQKTYLYDQLIEYQNPTTQQIGIAFNETYGIYDLGTTATKSGVVTTSDTNDFNTYTLTKDINITGGTSGGVFLGALAWDYEGHYNLKNITVEGTTATGGTVDGFWTYTAGATTPTDGFSGSIVGGNVNVTNTYTGGSAADITAYGVRFQGSANDQPGITGSVKFGDITVKADNAAGTGFVSGGIGEDGVVDLGKVDVQVGNWGLGVHINPANQLADSSAAPSDDNTGTLLVKEIYVVAGGEATGLDIEAGGMDNTTQDLAALNATIGKVYVESKATSGTPGAPRLATGILGADLSGITLTDDVTVVGGQVGAAALKANNAEVNIQGNVTVSAYVGTAAQVEAGTAAAGNAFQTIGDGGTGGDLTLNLIGNSVLNTQDSAIVANNDLNVNGGTLNSGTIAFKNDFNANNSIINISGDNLANSTLGSAGNDSQVNLINAKMNVTGDTTNLVSALDSGLFDDITAVNQDSKSGIFINTVNQIIIDENGDYAIGKADSAALTGGFVNAMRMHHNYTTWNAVQDHFIGGNSSFAGSTYRGQECPEYEIQPCDPVGCDPCDPCATNVGFGKSLARTAWVNYVARSNEYEDLYDGTWNYSAEGVQTGTDLFRTKRGQFGLLFGYEGGRLRNTADRVESENMYVGLYGARIFRNGWDVRGSFSYGWQDYDMNRFVANDDTYGASFKGHTTESNIELGKRMAWRGGWSVRPVIGIDVYNNNIKSAQESALAAGTGAISYDKNSLTQVFLRAGSDLRFQAKRFGLNGGLFYAYDLHGQGLESTITTTNGLVGSLRGSELGRELLIFNAGVDIAVAKNFTVFGGYRGESVLDGDGDGVTNTGYVGGAWKW